MQNDDYRNDNLEENIEETEENVEEETPEEEEDDVEESESKEDEPDWEAEAKKWKAIAERNKKKKSLQNKAQEPDDDIKADVQYLKLSEKKRQFGYENNLSPEETDKIFQINPNPTKETLKDPFVKAGIDALRRSKRLEDNVPSSSAKSNPVVTKKFKEMSDAEKNAEWQKYMKNKGVLK